MMLSPLYGWSSVVFFRTDAPSLGEFDSPHLFLLSR
jgi:hypothetical protein